VGPRIRRSITGFTLSETGRTISMGVDTAPRLLTIINVHVPRSARPEEGRAAIHDELSELIRRARLQGAILAAGDVSARLQGVLSSDREIIGPHVFEAGAGRIMRPTTGDTETTNSDLLVYLCRVRGVLVLNTWYTHRDSAKVTVRVPGGPGPRERGRVWSTEYYSELDFFLAPKRWRKMARDAR